LIGITDLEDCRRFAALLSGIAKKNSVNLRNKSQWFASSFSITQQTVSMLRWQQGKKNVEMF
jgi:hypothetical protein